MGNCGNKACGTCAECREIIARDASANYPLNVCVVCGAPQLGAHYHETNTSNTTALFAPTMSGMESGTVQILGLVDPATYDETEMGMMFHVRYLDGSTATAFADELVLNSWQ